MTKRTKKYYYICNEPHNRNSKYCSRFCYEWDMKYFTRTKDLL